MSEAYVLGRDEFADDFYKKVTRKRNRREWVDRANQKLSSKKHRLTVHAWEQMSARSLCPTAIDAALQYGRVAHTRGAVIYAIGRKEVQCYKKHGIDLSDYESLQVVCSPDDGAILTIYKNRDFRSLRRKYNYYQGNN